MVHHCDVSDIVSRSSNNNAPQPTQLMSVKYHSQCLLAGTTCGHLLVLDAANLSPLLCLQPHLVAASYRVLYSVLPLPGIDKYLTIGVGANTFASNSTEGDTQTRHRLSRDRGRKPAVKPPVHIISWYINPSESV